MAQWIRFEEDGVAGFGTLDGETVAVHSGDMFAGAEETGAKLPLSAVTLLPPCLPGKLVALWNNSRSAAEKQGLTQPEEPLIFIKASNTYLSPGAAIRKPKHYDGRVIYEAELGIVIGRQCTDVPEADAPAHIFGYTCVNDVTALQLLDADPGFPQWTRAKGFDTFCPFGPAIVTDADLTGATIRAELNGRERQNYPVDDLFLQPAALVAALSRSMTLHPGDLIACGTGPGALPMKPGSTIDIAIDGVGRLSNTYEE